MASQYKGPANEPTNINVEMTTTPPPPRTGADGHRLGWFTSEFALTALTIVAVVFLMALGRITVGDLDSIWPLFIGTGAYSMARGVAKINR